MKKQHIIFILLTVILLAAIAAWSIPLGTSDEVLPVTLNVTGGSVRELGFAVSHEEQKELDFGTTFPGTTVIKTVNISRGSQPPAFVSISSEGSIVPWLEVSDNDFLLKDPKQVKVSVVVPADAQQGLYTGQLNIAYRKTLFSLFLA
jgi:hypothetical protein